MASRAKIMGAGIAGLTGAQILLRCGWTVDIVFSGPTPERWITLSSRTEKLIDNLWGRDVLAESLRYPLHGRRVSWAGGDGELVADPLCAIELSSLTAAMRRNLAANTDRIVFLQGSQLCAEEITDAPVVIEARGRAPASPSRRLHSGNRHIRVWSAVEVTSPAGAIAEIVLTCH